MLTAYYITKTVKVEGKKQKKNLIIAIQFNEMGGIDVATKKRNIVFYCSKNPFIVYRVW